MGIFGLDLLLEFLFGLGLVLVDLVHALEELLHFGFQLFHFFRILLAPVFK